MSKNRQNIVVETPSSLIQNERVQKRPWPIVILSALLILTPVLNGILHSRLLELSFFEYFSLILSRSYFLEWFNFFALIPLAGASLYLMRKWSLSLFYALILTSTILNGYFYFAHPESYPLSRLLAHLLFNGFIIGYTFVPEVRSYFYRKDLKWWEQAPRFEVNLPVQVISEEGLHLGEIKDLSVGGAFVTLHSALQKKKQVAIELENQREKLRVTGEIKYQDTRRGGHGISFNPDPEQDLMIRKWIREYQKSGILSKRKGVPFPRQGFWSWAYDFFTTGEGWIPRSPRNHHR